ncbi:hypothetical protein AB4156_40585, partial [Cupriavidus sp. 2MCAB6]|uniref:hypothetical protein n=1 Tax=Cupriavidus sp. 2MCAB6 TaxID=3232981 RepID=UPI003F8E06F6
TNRSDYHLALARIGELEDLSECEGPELNALRTAVEDYQSLSSPDGNSRMPAEAESSRRPL